MERSSNPITGEGPERREGHGSRSPRLGSRRDLLWILALGLLALGVRVPNLTEREIWIDEANSVLIALGSPAGVIESLTVDGNPPLYYLLLHVWVRLFGFGEVAVRGLSVGFGCLLVAMLYRIGRTWFGRWAGVLAALFAALSPLHAYYSREARMYSIMAVWGLLTLWALDRLLVRRSWPAFAVAVLVMTGSVYTHNYGLFVLPVGLVAALFLPGPRLANLLRAAGAAGASLLLAAAWLPVVVRQARSGVGDWIPDLFHGQVAELVGADPGPVGSFVAGLLRSLQAMSPGSPYPFYLRKLPVESPAGFLPLALTLLLVLGAIVLLGLRRGKTLVPEEPAVRDRSRLVPFRVALLVTGLVVPIALPLGYSVLIKPVFLIGRYEILCFGALCLLVAVGAEVLARVAWLVPAAGVRAGFVVVFTGLSALSLGPYLFGPNPLPPFARRIASHLEEKAKPGDVLLFSEATRATAEYAIRRRGIEDRFVMRSFPRKAGLHPGWYDPQEFRKSLPEVNREAIALVDELHDQLDPGGQLWLLFEGRYPDLHEVFLSELRARFGDYRRRRSKVKVALYCFVKR